MKIQQRRIVPALNSNPVRRQRPQPSHLARFNYLEQCVLVGSIDERRLQALEVMDQLFPDLEPAVYC